MNIQLLEPRRLMAVTTGYDGDRKLLRIISDDSADAVHLAYVATGTFGLFINGSQEGTVPLAEVSKIAFYGNGGNDLFTAGRINVRVYAEGGTGADSLSASEGNRADTLYGNDGKDYLFGGGGNDTLDGGLGGDRMLGGAGADGIFVRSEVPTDDFASGGDGNDYVSLKQYTHGTTNKVGLLNPTSQEITDVILGDVEVLEGSDFNDTIDVVSGRAMTIIGGAGDDTITGGRGNDDIRGGIGFDVLSGAGGDDLFDSSDDNNTRDTVNGGTGNDQAKVSPIDVTNSVTVIGTGITPA